MGLATLCLSNSMVLSANPNKAPLDTQLNHSIPIAVGTQAIIEAKPELANQKSHQHHLDSSSTLNSKSVTQLAVAAACDTNGYATKTGQALVDHILEQDGSCINDLYDANATSFAAFQPAKMITVANAAASTAQGYTAAAGPNNINNLYYFLRTGYYHEYYSPDQVGPYGEDVQSVIRQALDNFVNNADFYANSDQHGKNIRDAIILIDSAGENARYLPMIKEWLNRWDSNYASSWDMRSSVNGIFTVLFRGHYLTDFQNATANDTQLIQSLGSFARSDWMLTSDALYLQENAAGELARFLQYDTAPIYSTVKSEVQSILNRYDMTGNGNSVWIRAATVVDYEGKCSEFNICGFKDELEAQILSNQHTCSSSLKFRAQDMTTEQFNDSCSVLAIQESFFHQMLGTNQTPVADDFNTSLEMVVFDSSSDYGSYAGLFFGIDTNNGGIYLEGDPSDVNNQARFIAYEAEWLRPDFQVWNLAHEHVHYLDGRYNLKGDFGDARTGTHKTVWWIEGLAEYISQKNLNDAAITLARTKALTLTQVFDSNYNSGTDRVYRWSYLAVRFMFENHHSDVEQILSLLRAGDYEAYLSFINNLSGSYDNEWLAWLDTVQSDNSVPTPPNQGGLTNGQVVNGLATPADNSDLEFYIDVPANATNLKVEISGGSGDADLYVKYNSAPTNSDYDCRPYRTGNNEVCNQANPQAGRWYINLKTYQNFSNVSLQATYSESDPSVVTPLTKGQAETNLTLAAAGEELLFSIEVPAGASDLNIDISGGSGDADLYVKHGSIPTDSDYDCRPYIGGNNESCSVAAPQSGTWYVRVKSYQAFSGVQLLADYATASGGFDACGSSAPVSSGNVTDGVAVCVDSSTNISYFYTYVNEGTSSLLVELSGGTGNGDLYGNVNTWATATSHQFSSTQSANTESMVMNVTQTGWVYFSVAANPEHGQTSLRVTHQ